MQLYEDPTELTAQVSALLAGEAAPSSAALLQLALICLQTGHLHQATRLRSDLQEVFEEEMAQADRPLALQLWDQLCRRCPDWSWARLMACDLALQAEQLELCHHHIEAAPETERRSISLLDVEARLRLQQQFVQEALRCWDAAIEQARAEGQFKWALALVNRRHAVSAVLRSVSNRAWLLACRA